MSFWAVSGERSIRAAAHSVRVRDPSPKGDLGLVEGSEGDELAGPESGDGRFVLDEELFELVDGCCCRFHTPNISLGYDKKLLNNTNNLKETQPLRPAGEAKHRTTWGRDPSNKSE